MITTIIRHTVADYAKWRPVFDADESNRKAAGVTGVPSVYRDLANPNKITVVLEWKSAEDARKFTSNPKLAEAMKAGGVLGAPEADFLTRA